MFDRVLHGLQLVLVRVAAAACCLLPISVMAQQAASGRIALLNVDRGGNFIRIHLDTPMVNPGNCPAAEFYILEVQGAGSNRMIAALYAAHVQRAPVQLWIHACTAAPYWGAHRPSVMDVYWFAP